VRQCAVVHCAQAAAFIPLPWPQDVENQSHSTRSSCRARVTATNRIYWWQWTMHQCIIDNNLTANLWPLRVTLPSSSGCLVQLYWSFSAESNSLNSHKLHTQEYTYKVSNPLFNYAIVMWVHFIKHTVPSHYNSPITWRATQILTVTMKETNRKQCKAKYETLEEMDECDERNHPILPLIQHIQ